VIAWARRIPWEAGLAVLTPAPARRRARRTDHDGGERWQRHRHRRPTVALDGVIRYPKKRSTTCWRGERVVNSLTPLALSGLT
jgi:hypothetical protein